MTDLNTTTANHPGSPDTTNTKERARIPAGALRLVRATSANVGRTEYWAAAEGWNPGRGDAVIFQSVDPAGYFAGYLGKRHVSTVNVLNYSSDLAFCGGLLVDPELRGRDIGTGTLVAAAIAHAGQRTLAADVPVGLIDKAEQLGFTSAFKIIRFSGRLPPPRDPDPHVKPLKATEHGSQIARLDAACFPAERPGFALQFATTAEHHALVHTDANGNVGGYGVLRPARSMARIGPLYAERSYQSATIFDRLCALAADAGAIAVTMDVPEPSLVGRTIADTRGLSGVLVAHRMYRAGTAEPLPVDFSQLHALTCLGMG